MAPKKQTERPTLDLQNAEKILEILEQDFIDFTNKIQGSIDTFKSFIQANKPQTDLPRSVPLKEAVKLLRQYYADKFHGNIVSTLEDQPHTNLNSIYNNTDTYTPVIVDGTTIIPKEPKVPKAPSVVKRKRDTKKPTKPVHDEEWFKKYVEDASGTTTVPESGLVVNEVGTQPLTL